MGRAARAPCAKANAARADGGGALPFISLFSDQRGFSWRFRPGVSTQSGKHANDRHRGRLGPFERKQMTAFDQLDAKMPARQPKAHAPHLIRLPSTDETGRRLQTRQISGEIMRNGAVDAVFDVRIEGEPRAAI